MSAVDEGNPWVVRTDFSNNQVWDEVKRLVSMPHNDPLSDIVFYANVRFVEESLFANLTGEQVVHALPERYPGFVVFAFDSETIKCREHSLLVVGFLPQGDDPSLFARSPSQTPVNEIQAFRAIPAAIQSIENNLSIANMDFKDFAGAVNSDGIFRGFKG
jgi:hypothetical protein